jgi:hypothetical protein
LQKAKRGLLPYGYDSVDIEIPQMQAAGIGELKLYPHGKAPNAYAKFMSVRTQPDGVGTTIWDYYDFIVDAPHVDEAMNRPNVLCADLALFIAVHSMWLLLVSGREQLKTQNRIQQPLLRVPLEHLKRIVRPMFKKLPQGSHRSKRAEMRSIESGKGIPPDGKTFARTDFDPRTHQPVPSRAFTYVYRQKSEQISDNSAQNILGAHFKYTSELLSF